MDKKSKIKKILAFGTLILLLLLFIIFTTKNCKTTKAEEIITNYSTISLYDNNNNLIASKPLEPLINKYNGTYEELGKTLLIENELINSNEKYTFVIEFNNVGNVRYYTSNFKWICNYKTIAVDYEIKLTFLNGADNETTITYTPYDYYNDKSFLIIPNRIFSGSAELSVPVISLSYSLYPSSNIFYSFIDTTYNGYGLGYADGYNDGYNDGIQYNNNEIYMQGYNFGKQDGYNLGKIDGYNEGYADGYNEGYSQIFEETTGLIVNFNQLIKNGNFETNYSNDFVITGLSNTISISQSDNKLTLNNFNAQYTNSGLQQAFNFIPNNKYYITAKITNISDINYRFLIGQCYGVNDTILINANQTDVFKTILTPTTVTGDGYNRIAITGYRTNLTCSFILENFMCINLTQIYGEGNEPTIETFIETFPSEYYPYTTSDIININYETGYNDGYNDGEYNGIIQGETHQIERTNFMTELFNSFDAFLNIHLLPNMTIGLLVFIPLMISITWFVIKAFRGGGSE